VSAEENGENGENGGEGPGRREVAHRLFAAEFEDADLQYSESDEERAPNYVVTPSGARVNRLFFVGVLTELEQVNESMLRARIVDPTGAFVAYAGQYQPDELAFLERAEPPTFLAVTGKARTFQPEDSDRVFTSVRPESINEVDAATRDRWVVDAARRTVERIAVASRAIDSGLSGDALRESLTDGGVDPSLASGITLALDHYGTTPAYLAALRETALDAVRVVADEIEEVEGHSVAPDEGGDATVPDRASGTGTAAGTATDSGAGGATRAESAGDEDVGAASAGGADDEGAASTATEPEPAADAPDPDADSDAARPSAPAEDEPDPEANTPAADAEPAEEAPTEDVGEFDVGELDADGDADSGTAAGGETDHSDGDESFDPEEDVLDPDEREEIESEYGTDFSTAGDVEAEPEAAPDVDPGDADTAEPEAEPEGPAAATEPEATADANAEPGTEPDVETGTGTGDATGTDAGEDGDAEPAAGDESEGAADGAEPADIEAAVLAAIEALDDGDGADRDAVVARVADEHGVSESVADDAIEEAMMSGRCYEPADGRVKSI